MIVIDYKDTRPIYEQIVEKLQTLIIKGVFEPGGQLPSVRSLAMELSINPNTIQKSYAELERRGFIYTVKGRGNFVSPNNDYMAYKIKEIQQRLDSIIKDAEEIGVAREKLADYIVGKEQAL